MRGAEPRRRESGRMQDDLQPIRRLYPFLAKYPVSIGLALICLLVSAVASLFVPALVGRFIDSGLIEANLSGIAAYVPALIGIGLVMAVTNALRLYFISSIGERLVADLRQAVFSHLLALDSEFFDQHKVGELTSRLNSDAATIRSVLSSTAAILLRSAVVLAGSVVMMLGTDLTLGGAVLLAGPLLILPSLYVARRLRWMSRRTQDTLAEMSALATEMLGAQRTVKSFVQESRQAEIYRARGDENVQAELRRLAARAGMVGIVGFAATVAVVGLAWAGAVRIASGAMTHGELVQLLVYAFMASGSLSSLSEGFGAVNSLRGSMHRLVDLMARTPTIVARGTNPAARVDDAVPVLEFDNVSFRYRVAPNIGVLQGVSFTARARQKVALVGPSGSGKSTVLSLIQRLYEADAGTIRLYGQDIRDLDPRVLRRRMAVVEQDPPIFSGTVLENIRFARPDASAADARDAARSAMLLEFVEGLPRGFDTQVGERGLMLSGGQRQRLAIARAILKDAPLLLLDEATSALDSRNEALVQAALDDLSGKRTVIVVAHRLSTIQSSDCIIVLDKGRVRAQGGHEDLTRTDSLYAEMVRLQFSRPDASAYHNVDAEPLRNPLQLSAVTDY